MDKNVENDLFTELLSSELTQIKINQYSVDFIFVEGPVISVESIFEHINREGLVLSRFEIYGTSKDVTVHTLLGAKITDAGISEENFVIKFGNGESIKIVKDFSRKFESYSIFLTGKHHVC